MSMAADCLRGHEWCGKRDQVSVASVLLSQTPGGGGGGGGGGGTGCCFQNSAQMASQSWEVLGQQDLVDSANRLFLEASALRWNQPNEELKSDIQSLGGITGAASETQNKGIHPDVSLPFTWPLI